MRGRFGLSAALTTPFDAEGKIQLKLMASHAQSCLARGCDSITVFGTTGEGASVGQTERGEVIDALTKGGIAPGHLVVAVTANALADAQAQVAAALDGGAKAVLLAPPSYFKSPTEAGVENWFSAVFDAVGSKARDIILYHIPSVTMVGVSAALVTSLRKAYPKAVMGVKDSGGDWSHTEALLKAHGDLAILIGDERDLARGVRMGGQGAISGVANIAPELVREMAVDGKDRPEIVDLVSAILHHPVTPAVKTVLAHVSGEASWTRVRPPLVPTGATGAKALAATFDTVVGSKAI